jgi:hypothetical protein
MFFASVANSLRDSAVCASSHVTRTPSTTTKTAVEPAGPFFSSEPSSSASKSSSLELSDPLRGRGAAPAAFPRDALREFDEARERGAEPARDEAGARFCA